MQTECIYSFDLIYCLFSWTSAHTTIIKLKQIITPTNQSSIANNTRSIYTIDTRILIPRQLKLEIYYFGNGEQSIYKNIKFYPTVYLQYQTFTVPNIHSTKNLQYQNF